MTGFPALLSALKPEVERTLDQLLPRAEDPPRRLHEAIRYSTLAGGKRIRPALLVMTGEVLGVPPSACLPPGAAVEMIHTYSLIHDDLPALDNDDLRRGQPTLHRRFDEATAILAGDALLTLGLTTLAAHPIDATAEQRRAAVETVGFAIGTRGMIGGQADDLAAEAAWPADAPAALAAIHHRKTGALLVVCLRLAGLYAGASAQEDRRLRELGEALGLMFQIADDIIDVEGTDEKLGKTAGKDAAARKLTYPSLFGLAESRRRLDDARRKALDLAAGLPAEGGPFPSLIHYLANRDR